MHGRHHAYDPFAIHEAVYNEDVAAIAGLVASGK